MHPNSRKDALEAAAPTPTPHTWASLCSPGRGTLGAAFTLEPMAWAWLSLTPRAASSRALPGPASGTSSPTTQPVQRPGCLCGGRKACQLSSYTNMSL